MFCSALTFHFLSFSWYPWEYYPTCRCAFPPLAFSLSIGLDFPMWLTSKNTNIHESRICLGHHRTPRTWHKVWRWWVINYNHWNCVSSFLSIAFWAPTSYHISVRPITSLDSQPLQNSSWYICICKRCIDRRSIWKTGRRRHTQRLPWLWPVLCTEGYWWSYNCFED